MIALQTAFPVLLKARLSPDIIVQKMAVKPRQLLGLQAATITEGANADLTVLDTVTEWVFTKQNNQSKSYNSPFIGQNLKGGTLLTINNNQLFKSHL